MARVLIRRGVVVARSRVERSEFYSARPSGELARESFGPGRVEPVLKDALKDS